MSILHDLGIEPRELLINIISFLVLLWLMKRYLFGTVGAFIKTRQEAVARDLDSAQADREKAQGEREAIESSRAELMDAARRQAEQAAEEARRDAAAVAKAARDQAREVERSARAATEREQELAAAQLRGEVSGAAAAMCDRILRQTLTQERHRALLDEFIADIETMAAGQQGQQ